MPNKNTVDTYNQYKTALNLIQDKSTKDFPKFTETEFLEVFGVKLQEQLSNAGRIVFETESPAILSLEKFTEAFKKDYEETLITAKKDFLESFDLDATLSTAQTKLEAKLTQTKDELLKEFTDTLSANDQTFTAEDESKLNVAFTQYFDKNHKKLSAHLETFKALPATIAKLLLHSAHTEAKNKADNNSFTVEQLPALEKLTYPSKPEPSTGFRVNRDNLAKQIQHDLASATPGTPIDIKVSIPNPNRQDIMHKLGNIGLQYKSPGQALLNILLFYILVSRHNDEKRVFQAIEKLVKENNFLIDPKKITLEITSPTSYGNDKITRKKGPLSEEFQIKLQSMVDEIKNKLQEYGHGLPTKKLSESDDSSESGYSSGEEAEDIAPPRPR